MALPGEGLSGAGVMPRLWRQDLILGRNLDGAPWEGAFMGALEV